MPLRNIAIRDLESREITFLTNRQIHDVIRRIAIIIKLHYRLFQCSTYNGGTQFCDVLSSQIKETKTTQHFQKPTIITY